MVGYRVFQHVVWPLTTTRENKLQLDLSTVRLHLVRVVNDLSKGWWVYSVFGRLPFFLIKGVGYSRDRAIIKGRTSTLIPSVYGRRSCSESRMTSQSSYSEDTGFSTTRWTHTESSQLPNLLTDPVGSTVTDRVPKTYSGTRTEPFVVPSKVLLFLFF